MESPEREVVGECVKIVGGMTRLRSARRVRQAPPPSSTIERDDAIARSREGVDLWHPALTRAGDRMHENDRFTVATGVGEPQLDARQRCQRASVLRWRLGPIRLHCSDDHGRRDREENRDGERRTRSQSLPRRISRRLISSSCRTRMRRQVSSELARISSRVFRRVSSSLERSSGHRGRNSTRLLLFTADLRKWITRASWGVVGFRRSGLPSPVSQFVRLSLHTGSA